MEINSTEANDKRGPNLALYIGELEFGILILYVSSSNLESGCGRSLLSASPVEQSALSLIHISEPTRPY